MKLLYLIKGLYSTPHSAILFLQGVQTEHFLNNFWRLIPESLNLFIFLANILQGDVPGLCGPFPGAKLKLPFLIFMACSQSVNLNFTPYCIHLKLAFIVIDISAEKIPGLTPEWNIKITNPHLLPRIRVFDWLDLGSVHQFANKYKLFTMFFLACTCYHFLTSHIGSHISFLPFPLRLMMKIFFVSS